MVDQDRASSLPLRSLKPLTVTDAGERMTLTAEEFTRLVEAAEAAEPLNNTSGHDRAVLYLTAGKTGLRPLELRQMRAGDFRLDQAPPVFTISAKRAKNRRETTLPIVPELAAVLRPHLATKFAGLVIGKGDPERQSHLSGRPGLNGSSDD